MKPWETDWRRRRAVGFERRDLQHALGAGGWKGWAAGCAGAAAGACQERWADSRTGRVWRASAVGLRLMRARGFVAACCSGRKSVAGWVHGGVHDRKGSVRRLAAEGAGTDLDRRGP